MKQNPPTAVIEAAHAQQQGSLPFDDTADFDDADRGFLGALSPCVVKAADGRVVWDNDGYAFLAGEPPTSVHPSLWRQSQLCAKQGLYEVVEGIYQVRGLDLSNISFIEGDTGIIVIDPLVSTETASAALALYRTHRGDRPVVAVIYTHSHVDHFGGVLGVTSQADVDAGKVAVLAPEGFTEHAVQENVYAGTAMARRAGYMYGAALDRGPQGQVGCGLGQTPSTGEVAIIVPTIDITTTGEKHTIDGVEIEFQMAPGTEAPAEMHFYFPRYKALCMAENATHNLHNLLTLRGALVRDPHGWAGYLTEAIDTFVDRADVVFASHHWPTWGRENIVEYLALQRDLYAYLHDQTLRQLNQGYTGIEIAENFADAARIWRRPGIPTATTARSATMSRPSTSVTWVGSTETPAGCGRTRQKPSVRGMSKPSVASIASSRSRRAAFDDGDYRWAATLLDHAMFTDEKHAGARELYVGTLRAAGLRRRERDRGATSSSPAPPSWPTATSVALPRAHLPTLMSQLTPEQIFDALAISVNGPKAWDLDLALDVSFTDLAANYRLTLRNGVLVHRKVSADPTTAGATVTVDAKARLLALAAGDSTSPGLQIGGDPQVLQQLVGVLDKADPGFNIITP